MDIVLYFKYLNFYYISHLQDFCISFLELRYQFQTDYCLQLNDFKNFIDVPLLSLIFQTLIFHHFLAIDTNLEIDSLSVFCCCESGHLAKCHLRDFGHNNKYYKQQNRSNYSHQRLLDLCIVDKFTFTSKIDQTISELNFAHCKSFLWSRLLHT